MSTAKSSVITYGGAPGSFGPSGGPEDAPMNWGAWARTVDLLPVPLNYQVARIHDIIPADWTIEDESKTSARVAWELAEEKYYSEEAISIANKKSKFHLNQYLLEICYTTPTDAGPFAVSVKGWEGPQEQFTVFSKTPGNFELPYAVSYPYVFHPSAIPNVSEPCVRMLYTRADAGPKIDWVEFANASRATPSLAQQYGLFTQVTISRMRLIDILRSSEFIMEEGECFPTVAKPGKFCHHWNPRHGYELTLSAALTTAPAYFTNLRFTIVGTLNLQEIYIPSTDLGHNSPDNGIPLLSYFFPTDEDLGTINGLIVEWIYREKAHGASLFLFTARVTRFYVGGENPYSRVYAPLTDFGRTGLSVTNATLHVPLGSTSVDTTTACLYERRCNVFY